MPKVSFCVCKWRVITNVASRFPDIISESACHISTSPILQVLSTCPWSQIPSRALQCHHSGVGRMKHSEEVGSHLIKWKQSAFRSVELSVSNNIQKLSQKCCANLHTLRPLIAVDLDQFPQITSISRGFLHTSKEPERAPPLLCCKRDTNRNEVCTEPSCLVVLPLSCDHATVWFHTYKPSHLTSVFICDFVTSIHLFVPSASRFPGSRTQCSRSIPCREAPCWGAPWRLWLAKHLGFGCMY